MSDAFQSADRRNKLVTTLARTLGHAKAAQLVQTTARAEGIDLEHLTDAEVAVLLRKLGETPGLIGITAQLVQAQLRLETLHKPTAKTS